MMRCPLCRNEYPLEEALNNLPPQLEIVSATQPESEPLVMTHDLPAPHDLPFEMSVPFTPLPFVPPDEPVRLLRRPRSTARMMLEVIIGALLAGPLAMLIIMWGFGRDPLHLAEKLPQFLVPPSMRSDAPDRQGPVMIDVN
jgi:hypothetical protein